MSLSLRQILLYSTGNLGANLVFAFANFAFPLFLSAYAVPQLLVGFLAQERSFVGAFVQPVVGAISDRMPPNRLGKRRPFFLIGVPLTAASLVFLSGYPPIWAVVAMMTLFSLFLAVANDPYLALMPDISQPEERGRIGGVMGVFSMLGAIVVLLLSFLLWEQHQALLFWLVAGGLMICFAVTLFGVREPTIVAKMRTVGAEYASHGGAGSPGGETRAFHGGGRSRVAAVGAYIQDLLGHREIIKYLAATFCFWLGNGGIAPFLTRFGTDVVGAEQSTTFLLVLPAVLGSAAFAVPAGLLAERHGKKPVLNLGMLGFGSLALVGGMLVSTIPQAVALMSLVGVANAVTNALIFPLLADLIPRDRAGEFTGLGSMVWSLSQTLGALGAGAMADATGSLRGAFALGGLCMLAGFGIMLTVEVTPNPPAPFPPEKGETRKGLGDTPNPARRCALDPPAD